MVDIDPTVSVSMYAPRNTTLVDAVAEAKRIADQSLRSNPLKDAVVDSGLTRWIGNYGGSLVWIGEFEPADQNLVDNYGNKRSQRGFVLQRDDPSQSFALTMYDPNPVEGVPLNQRLIMWDAGGRRLFMEGRQGGRQFPDRLIPMYQNYGFAPEATGLTHSTATVAWRGEGHVIGHRLDFEGAWTTIGGTPTVNSQLRVTGVGGTVITSNTATISGPSFVNHSVSLIGPLWDNEDYIRVEWLLWRTGTGGYFPRPTHCRNLSL